MRTSLCQGGELATSEAQEAGDLFFLYQPKVERDGAEGLEDVERFHLVLRPGGRALWRLLLIGAKRMPDRGSHERNWGFVDRVLRDAADVRAFFAAQTYETNTRRTRHLPAARPAGEGVYALAERAAPPRLPARPAGAAGAGPGRTRHRGGGCLRPGDPVLTAAI